MSKTEKVSVTIESEALAKALGVSKGAKTNVECRDGVPIDQYWRNRFKDSETDGSLKIGKSKAAKKEA